MADRPQPRHVAHPTPFTYLKVAIILATLTAIEVAVFYVDSLRPAFLPIFLILSAAKFSLVVLFFMHLRFDSRLFSGVFIGGLVLAVSVGVLVMSLFQVLSATAGVFPTPTSMKPANGPTAGGTTVTILGKFFDSEAVVTFGGMRVTPVTFLNPNTLTVTAPAHDRGAVDVVVTNPDEESGALSGGYTYGLAVTSVLPKSGPTTGGTAVTVRGVEFVPGAGITFGGIPATNVTFLASTTLTGDTPAHPEGAVDVMVTTPDGRSATLSDGYTYTTEVPLGCDPAKGPVEYGKCLFLNVPDSVGPQSLWCSQCHQIEGISAGQIGPDQTHIGTDAATRKPGMSAEDYIRESIVDPEVFVAEGVDRATPGLMTSDITEGLTDEEVDALVAFLLTVE